MLIRDPQPDGKFRGSSPKASLASDVARLFASAALARVSPPGDRPRARPVFSENTHL